MPHRYEIMSWCWNANPDDRPIFSLIICFKSMLPEPERLVRLDTVPSISRINSTLNTISCNILLQHYQEMNEQYQKRNEYFQSQRDYLQRNNAAQAQEQNCYLNDVMIQPEQPIYANEKYIQAGIDSAIRSKIPRGDGHEYRKGLTSPVVHEADELKPISPNAASILA